ncbi:hypothetical protein GGI21_006261, partial [Coemansia aciculifera]
MARTLKIAVNLLTVYSGDALSSLEREFPDVQSLPLIRSVYLELGYAFSASINMSQPSGVKANIRAFSQKLKQLVPNIIDIEVRVCDFRHDRHKPNPDLRFGYLLSHLFQLCTRVKFSNSRHFIRTSCLQLNITCHLTHIDFQLRYDRKLALRMISQNAPILKSLALNIPKDADLSGLFLSSERSNVEYPNLLSLKFTAIENDDIIATQREFPGAVPFPSLRRLMMKCDYMFSDDFVFRGNSATLEYLQLRLTDTSFEILQSHNVFTLVNYPKLRHVDVDLTSYFFDKST